MSGMDCVGLLVRVSQDLGVPHYDQTAYKRRTNGIEFLTRFRKAGFAEKNMLDRKHGDILVIEEDGFACHVALFISEGDGKERMIHSYAARRKIVEEPYTDFWKGKTVGCYSFPGVKE